MWRRLFQDPLSELPLPASRRGSRAVPAAAGPRRRPGVEGWGTGWLILLGLAALALLLHMGRAHAAPPGDGAAEVLEALAETAPATWQVHWLTADSRVLARLQTPTERLWGTDAGLWSAPADEEPELVSGSAGLPGGPVLALCSEDGGGVFASLQGEGVWRRDAGGLWGRVDAVQEATVTALLRHGDLLLVGTPRHLVAYGPGVAPGDSDGALPEEGAAFGARRVLWKGRPITALGPDPRHAGRALVGAGPYGLYRLRPANGGRARLLGGEYVRGLVWEGRDLIVDTPTRRCRLPRGRASRRRCAPLPDSAFAPLPGALPSPHVTALAVHQGQLWAGTFDAGLTRLGEHGWERVPGSDEDRVLRFANGLEPDGRGGLWLASPNGAARLGPEGRWRRYGSSDGLPSEHVNAVLHLRDATWLATSKGAVRLDDGGVASFGTADGLPGRIVYSLAAWGGAVVAGTDRGVGVLQEGRWRRFSHEDGSLSDNWVNALCATPDALFVGTYDAGIDRITAGQSAQTEPAGALWINPSGLHAPAPGWLLAATLGDGLHARHPDGRWSRLAPPQTLPSQDVTAARVYRGSLWVATRRGVAVLTPTRP